MDYECKITATTKPITEDFIELESVEIDFSSEKIDRILGKQGLTNLGFQFFNTVLASAVSNFARSATQFGLSEGAIIAHFIQMLEENLANAENKAPESRTGTR